MESCYRLEGTEQQWLRRVLSAARPHLDRGLGVQAAMYHWRPGKVRLDHVEVLGVDGGVTEFLRRQLNAYSPAMVDWVVRNLAPYNAHHEVMEAWKPGTNVYARGLPATMGIRDQVALTARNGPGNILFVGAQSPRVEKPGRRERWRYGRVAAHLATAWRLMRRLRSLSEQAIFDGSGRLLHAEADARPDNAREVLRAFVRQMDHARGSLRRHDPDRSLSLWPTLVSGRWSLVDRFESDGRRFVVAHRNDEPFLDPRALTEREEQCARLAATGHSNAEIAYEVGLSEATAGLHVARAMRKLGVRRRSQLTELLLPAAIEPMDLDPQGRLVVAGVTPQPHRFAALFTPTERHVVGPPSPPGGR
ncbi:MAG: helix-turn-helix transcriptional regulator [Myxococcota bacterium]